MTGAYALAPAALLPLAAALFLALLAAYSAGRRHVPGALALAFGAAFCALWLLGLALTILAVDPQTKLFWHKFQGLWQFPTVAANACFGLEYSRPGRWVRPPLVAALGAVTFFVAAGLFWDSSLFFRSLSVDASGAIAVQYSALGLIILGLGISLVAVNVVVFLRMFVRMPEQRIPVALMLAADLAAHLVYIFAIYRSANGTHANALVVFAHLLKWTIYAVALFGFRILDPLGSARLTVIRQMREGMVVFDNEWRVVSVNPAAERILRSTAARLRGQTWAEVLPGVEQPPAAPEEETPVGEVSLPAPGARAGSRSCALDLSPLSDQRKLRAGSLLLLLDITEQRRAQAQAQEQQRTLAVLRERERLARELHDDLAQVLGFVNAQGQTARLLLNRGDVQRADEHLARLIEVTREADADLREAILGLRVALPDAGLLPALRLYLREYEKRFGISTELVTTAPLGNGAFEPLVEAQLLRIVQEALTNARKHGHARTVNVTICPEEDRARLTVMDDGCGFQPGSADADGGEHVGLRVMRERAEEAGGSLEVRSAVGSGTQVIVTAPLRARDEMARGGKGARPAG